MILSLPGCPHSWCRSSISPTNCCWLKVEFELGAKRAQGAGGGCRHVEYAGTESEDALVPFGGCAVGGGPTIAAKIKRTGVDNRPVQEIGLRVVGVFVGVEYVGDKISAHSQNQTVLSIRLRKQVDVGIDLLCLAAEIDRLSDEIAVRARVWIVEAKLVGLAAREPGDAVGVCKTVALINLWIDPKLGSLPQPQAERTAKCQRFRALRRRRADFGRPHRASGTRDSLGIRTYSDRAG